MKCKCLPATPTKADKLRELFNSFAALVADEVESLEKKLGRDESVTSYRTTSEDQMYDQHTFSIRPENMEEINDKAWELKDLATANGQPDMFGCKWLYIEGAKKGMYTMYVFLLK